MKSAKLATNSHTYVRKAFKIYNKHHEDNHILLLHFLLHCKMKIRIAIFFCVKKIKPDFKPQIFTFFVGKVITFLETDIEQYVAIPKT